MLVFGGVYLLVCMVGISDGHFLLSRELRGSTPVVHAAATLFSPQNSSPVTLSSVLNYGDQIRDMWSSGTNDTHGRPWKVVSRTDLELTRGPVVIRYTLNMTRVLQTVTHRMTTVLRAPGSGSPCDSLPHAVCCARGSSASDVHELVTDPTEWNIWRLSSHVHTFSTAASSNPVGTVDVTVRISDATGSIEVLHLHSGSESGRLVRSVAHNITASVNAPILGGGMILDLTANSMSALLTPRSFSVDWAAALVVPASYLGTAANMLGFSSESFAATYKCGDPIGSSVRVAGGSITDQLSFFRSRSLPLVAAVEAPRCPALLRGPAAAAGVGDTAMLEFSCVGDSLVEVDLDLPLSDAPSAAVVVTRQFVSVLANASGVVLPTPLDYPPAGSRENSSFDVRWSVDLINIGATSGFITAVTNTTSCCLGKPEGLPEYCAGDILVPLKTASRVFLDGHASTRITTEGTVNTAALPITNAVGDVIELTCSLYLMQTALVEYQHVPFSIVIARVHSSPCPALNNSSMASICEETLHPATAPCLFSGGIWDDAAARCVLSSPPSTMAPADASHECFWCLPVTPPQMLVSCGPQGSWDDTWQTCICLPPFYTDPQQSFALLHAVVWCSLTQVPVPLSNTTSATSPSTGYFLSHVPSFSVPFIFVALAMILLCCIVTCCYAAQGKHRIGGDLGTPSRPFFVDFLFRVVCCPYFLLFAVFHRESEPAPRDAGGSSISDGGRSRSSTTTTVSTSSSSSSSRIQECAHRSSH